VLHEFMVRHRDEILEMCRQRLRDEVVDTPEIDRDVEIFFGEILQALRRHDGFTAAESPLPGPSETAARLGKEPQRAGLEPAKVPRIFNAIASGIGQVGQLHGLSINAEEYRVFNACIDSGVATSIETFWNDENQQRKQRIVERFGYLAHELRIAVGNAALAFKLLRAGDLDLNGRTAGVLANNLTRLETLVARTLGAVQLDSGIALEIRPLRVSSLLRRLQASAIPERAVSMTLEVDETLHVNADEMLLVSALSNLLNNAIKFSRTGGHVTLSCRTDHRNVLIEVEDECGGLGEDNPLLAFARDPSENFLQKAGLGLNITRRAVEAMNGSLYVENCPGHGCLFGVAFPPAQPNRISSVPPPPAPQN